MTNPQRPEDLSLSLSVSADGDFLRAAVVDALQNIDESHDTGRFDTRSVVDQPKPRYPQVFCGFCPDIPVQGITIRPTQEGILWNISYDVRTYTATMRCIEPLTQADVAKAMLIITEHSKNVKRPEDRQMIADISEALAVFAQTLPQTPSVQPLPT